MFRRLRNWIKRIFSKKRKVSGDKARATKPHSSTISMLASMYTLSNMSYKKITASEGLDVKVKVLSSKSRYLGVAEKFNMPWEVVAAIHSLEGSLNFHTALHNGERLPLRRTKLVPKGRGPFTTWEEAAIDALEMKRSIMPKIWGIGETLNFLETYNGLGYRKYHKSVNSPYLWSGTTEYSAGKYVRDGKFSRSTVSSQVGAVVILKLLKFGVKDV